MDLWLDGIWERKPDVVEVDKAHGRIERRELWIKPSHELGAYLEQEYGWSAMLWSGQIRRYRKRASQTRWEKVEQHTWVAGGALHALTAEQAARWLRGHWSIENSVFWVRDVSYSEDRNHARIIAPALSTIRDVAINLIRNEGFKFIPDAWRFLSAHPRWGLCLVFRS